MDRKRKRNSEDREDYTNNRRLTKRGINESKNLQILPILPTEIWFSILSLINYKKTIALRRVCKFWYSYLQQCVKYFETSIPEKVAKIYPNITNLTITKFNNIDQLLNFKKLKTLVFEGISPQKYFLDKIPIESFTWIGNIAISNKCLKDIFNDIKSSTTIKSLTIMGKNSYCNDCKFLYSSFTNIEELNLIDITNSHYEIFTEILKLPNLKKLTLVNTQFKQKPKAGFNVLLEKDSLKYLKITKNMLTLKEHEEFKKVFSNSNKILILE